MTRARPFVPAGEVPSAFDVGRMGRLTWLGLGVAAVGWVVLIASTVFSRTPLPTAAIPLHSDFGDVAKCLIASGFSLAVIGTLQVGFGALNRFFAAVLDRSATRSPQTAPTPVAGEPAAHPRGRPYNVLSDGSVEVETILGTRRFADMVEARDFI